MTPRRVLLVYSRVGGGHLSAARALKAALEAADGSVRVDLVDAYVECGRPPVTWFPAVYAELARHHPRLWAAFFAMTAMSVPGLDADHLFRPFLLPGFRRLLAGAAPDVVVSVLPAVNGLLAAAAADSARRPRVEVVLTDWCAVHPSWFGRGVDHYTAPTDAARLDLVRWGASPDAVDVVGVPVREDFASLPPRAEARSGLAELGLDADPARFTVLALVGAEGSPRALANVAALAGGLDAGGQLVVVCGRDAALRRRVDGLRRAAGVEVRALGFVDGIGRLMRAADLVVTKAGGVSLAEAFCCRAPVVVADLLAGQEQGNLRYALQWGAVAYAGSPAALARLVAEYARAPERRAALAERGAQLARPGAAACIAARLLAGAA
jgi:1,2-diacylglycerol 3-beta-galactosyltransferase